MDKENVVLIHNTIIFSHETLLFLTTWMELEVTTVSEINEAQKDKYCMISIICRLQKSQS
jgi:hypothetical protein